MKLSHEHVEVHVSSLEAAREFYVGTLGLDLLDDMPGLNLFAVRAGDIRISVFGGSSQETRVMSGAADVI